MTIIGNDNVTKGITVRSECIYRNQQETSVSVRDSCTYFSFLFSLLRRLTSISNWFVTRFSNLRRFPVEKLREARISVISESPEVIS